MSSKTIFNVLTEITILCLGVLCTNKVSLIVKQDDSVRLHSGVKTNEQEDIKWYCNDTRIAQIKGEVGFICTDVQCNKGTERFRDRLKLENQTGSLTIMNIRNTDSGEYRLLINSSSKTVFNVTSLDNDKQVKEKKNEGEPVTLDSREIRKPNYLMTWYFKETCIAEFTEDQMKICADVQCKEIFTDRLKLASTTGSLNITDTKTTDSGLYKLQIIISNSSFSITRVKRFAVTVTPLPHSGLSGGAITGIAFGVLLAAAVVAVGLYKSHIPAKFYDYSARRTS